MTSDATNVTQRHRQRYLSGATNSIDEIADPDSLEDSTASTIRDYVVNNKLWVLIGGAFVVVTVVLAFRWIAITAGNLLSNPLAQAALAILITAGVAYYAGRRHQLAVFTEVDEFVADGPNGPKRFFGEYVTDHDGKNQRFEPYKGFSRLGNPTSKLTVGELSPEWARKAENKDHETDAPASISLHAEFADVTVNDFGTLVSQPIEKIEPLEHGGKSVLGAEIPDMAPDGKIPKLKRQLEEAREAKSDREELIQTLREQRDAAQEEARKRREEYISEFKDHTVDMIDASRGRRRQADDEGGVGPSREPSEDELGVDIEIED